MRIHSCLDRTGILPYEMKVERRYMMKGWKKKRKYEKQAGQGKLMAAAHMVLSRFFVLLRRKGKLVYSFFLLKLGGV